MCCRGVCVCGYSGISGHGQTSLAPDAAFSEQARLTEFASNGVRVVVTIDSDPQGRPLLRGTFTPTERGFHLYGKDHDPNTAGGAGVATRLDLLPHSEIKPAGEIFSDVAPETHRVKALDASINVYPDGPVSLRLPIAFVGRGTNIAAQVAVSYMACNTDGECRQPVEGYVLNLSIARTRPD